MKILFILSGNQPKDKQRQTGPNAPLIKNAKFQGDSLIKMGYEVDFFYITGRGAYGYLKNLPKIRKKIQKGKYDIIHAHYGSSAILASIAGFHSMVVSLMGSDVFSNPIIVNLLKLFCIFRWKAVIVKTGKLKDRINCNKVHIIPNGVDLDEFRPLDRDICRRKLNLPLDAQIILFPSNPSRPEKNYELAEEAFSLIRIRNKLLLPVKDVEKELMPFYYNASNVVLITSLWEGSINSVKEAMACNIPIVSTNVGDVASNTNGLDRHTITSYDPKEIAESLEYLLENTERTLGSEQIRKLKLDTVSCNNKIIALYESVMKKNKKQLYHKN